MGAILSLLGLGQPQEATKKVTDYGKKLEKRVAKKQKKNVEETKKAVIEADKEATTKKKSIDDDLDLDDILKDSMKKEVDAETTAKKKIIADNAKVTQDALKAERVKNAAMKADLEERLKLLQAQRDEAIKKQKAAETREKEAIKAAQDAKTVRKTQEKTVTKTTAFLKDAKAEEKEAKKRMRDMRMKCRKKEERSTDVCRSVRFCNNPMNAVRRKSEYKAKCKPLFKKLNVPKSMLKKLERRIRKLKRSYHRSRPRFGRPRYGPPKFPRFGRPKRPRFPEFGRPKRPKFPKFRPPKFPKFGHRGPPPRPGSSMSPTRASSIILRCKGDWFYRRKFKSKCRKAERVMKARTRSGVSTELLLRPDSKHIEGKMEIVPGDGGDRSMNRSSLPPPFGEFDVFVKRFDNKMRKGIEDGRSPRELITKRDKRIIGMAKRGCNKSEEWRQRGGDLCRKVNEIVEKYN
jgi:chemotaxis protein histidine kinase CheA